MSFKKLLHLSKRFFIALWPAAPSILETRWAETYLRVGERTLFAALPNHDRRHLIGVARRVESSLGEVSEERWIAAALLHDVGNTLAKVGCFMGDNWRTNIALEPRSRLLSVIHTS